MKFKELLLDAVISTKLFEMAKSRNDLIQKISSYDWVIGSHLLKILMYGKVTDYEHWCRELNGWLISIQRYRLKRSGYRLSSDTLMKILWESLFEYVDEVQDHMGEIDAEYSKSYKIVEYQPSLIHKQLREILNNVCDDLSQGKFSDIRNYL